MAKYMKLLLLLILTTAFWGNVSDALTAKAVDATGLFAQSGLEEDENMWSNISQKGYYIPAPQLPYLSDAELTSSAGHTQLLTSSRAQRFYISEYILSMKDVVERMAHREGALSHQRSKLFDSTAFYRCHPVCEYYVFTLRKIII